VFGGGICAAVDRSVAVSDALIVEFSILVLFEANPEEFLVPFPSTYATFVIYCGPVMCGYFFTCFTI
jgi:hypothetical protein